MKLPRKWPHKVQTNYTKEILALLRKFYNPQQISEPGDMPKGLEHPGSLTLEASSVQFSCSVMSYSLWPHRRQGSLSIINSQSLLRLMSIESVMPFNHLTLCHHLFFLISICPTIKVFSTESVLCVRWPKFQLQHESFQWIFRTDFL